MNTKSDKQQFSRNKIPFVNFLVHCMQAKSCTILFNVHYHSTRSMWTTIWYIFVLCCSYIYAENSTYILQERSQTLRTRKKECNQHSTAENVSSSINCFSFFLAQIQIFVCVCVLYHTNNKRWEETKQKTMKK